MSGINWGLAPPIPQPVIAPSADKLWRAKQGLPVPARPAWMCITAPEYSVSSSNDLWQQQTPEQRAEIDARKMARKTILDKRREDREAVRLVEKERKRQEVIANNEHRVKRAAENKLRGFGPKPKKEKVKRELTPAQKERAAKMHSARLKKYRDGLRAARAKTVAAMLPPGYVKVASVKFMAHSTLALAVSRGDIPSCLINKRRYCDEAAALAWITSVRAKQGKPMRLDLRLIKYSIRVTDRCLKSDAFRERFARP